MQPFLLSISAQHHVFTFIYLLQNEDYSSCTIKYIIVHLEEVCYQQQPDVF